MGVLANIPSIPVSADGADLVDSLSGISKLMTLGAYGSAALLVLAGSPNTTYGPSSPTAGYIFDFVPGSAVQTFRLGVIRKGTVSGHIVYAMLHATPGGDDYLAASYSTDNWSVSLVKCVNGTRTTIPGSSVTVSALTIGASATFGIRISGTDGNWSVQAEHNGALIGSPFAVTEAVFDGVGRMGAQQRGGAPTPTTGLHVFSIYAEDDTVPAAAVLSSPTVGTPGATSVAVGFTTDRLSDGTAHFLRRVGGSAASAATIASTGESQAVTAANPQARTMTGFTASGANNYVDMVQAGAGGNSNVVTVGPFTMADLPGPSLTAPTKSTPTATSAVIGFTTDTGNGTARAVLTASATPPTAAQVKAGLDHADNAVGVVVPAALTITSAGIKAFGSAAVTQGKTYYGYIVHTNAAGTDSAVLAVGVMYPGTGRPVSDVDVTGWTASTGSDLWAMLDEDTASDTDYVTSPALSVSATTGSHALDKTYTAGTYSIKVRAKTDTGAGTLAVRLLNGSNVSQGVTADQAITSTWTTYTLPITITGDATRIRYEVVAA